MVLKRRTTLEVKIGLTEPYSHRPIVVSQDSCPVAKVRILQAHYIRLPHLHPQRNRLHKQNAQPGLKGISQPPPSSINPPLHTANADSDPRSAHAKPHTYRPQIHPPSPHKNTLQLQLNKSRPRLPRALPPLLRRSSSRPSHGAKTCVCLGSSAYLPSSFCFVS